MNKYINNYINRNNLIELTSIDGHKKLLGKTANIEKNKIVFVMNTHAKSYAIMYCEINTITKISIDSVKRILDSGLTWYKLANGYVGAHYNKSIIYLHQFLMNYYGNGKGKMSIDHINRDKLDNRIDNLRIVSQSVQNENCGKRERKYNAQNLPPEIDGIELPKYCYYCSEVMNKGKSNQYVREYFRIEKHPNLDKKCVSTSKSTKISILDKLNEAKKIIKNLNNNIKAKEERDLPKYVRLYSSKRTTNKLVLEYERRVDGKRQSKRLTFDCNNKIDDKLNELKVKVQEKFNYNILE